MFDQLPMNEARKCLPKLADEFEAHPQSEAVSITRRGKPVLAVMSWELYESMVETMEIMADKELMRAFRKSVKEIEAGKLIPWEDVKKELGL